MANTKGNRRRFGAVRKLKSGRFQARYPGVDGVLRPAPETFRTKTDAEQWLVRAEAKIMDGQWIDPDAGKITVEEWGVRWFASVSPSLKAKTVNLYGGVIRLWINPRLGPMPLASVRPITVAEWVVFMRKSKLSPSRIRTAYRLFAQMMKAAADNDMIPVTPCRGIKIPRLPETEPHILTDDEVARLISHMRQPHDLLVKLLASAGLRIGEGFALRRSDVLFDKGMIRVDEAVEEINGHHVWDVPKSHQTRSLRVPAYLLEELRVHLDENVGEGSESLLFVNTKGTALRYNAWRTWHFDKAVEKAGLKDVTPHDLRATHATWVADRHGVLAAAKRLGHSNASVTTRHYARAVDQRVADVADTLDAERTKAQEALRVTFSDAATDTPADLAQDWHGDDEDGAAGALVPT